MPRILAKKRSIKFSSDGRAKRDVKVMSKRDVNIIKRIALSTAETKAHFVKVSQSDLAVADYHLINGLTQGDTEVDREGSKVLGSSIEWRFICANVSGTPDPTIYRLLVVMDRVPDGISMSLTDLLNINSGSDPVIAMRNTNYLERFKVLMDRTYSIGATSSSYGGTPNTMHDHGYIDLSRLEDKDRLVRYIGTGNTIAEININSIYFIVVPSNQTAFSAPSAYAQYSFNTKYNFKDN